MNTWHVPPDVLARYATAPEEMDAPSASSIEQHVVACGECRAQLASVTDDALLERSWSSVAEVVDRPHTGLLPRLLGALGVDESYARVLAGTPSLGIASVTGAAAIAAGLLVLSISNDDAGPFLVLAPILPLLVVAVAFWPGADPAGEAGVAAPLSGFALLIRRTAALLVPTLLLTALASLAVPGAALADAVWILPALALSITAVALSTWIRIEAAAGALASGWLALLLLASRNDDVRTRELAPLRPGAQLVWVALAAIAAAVTLVRRDTFAIERQVR